MLLTSGIGAFKPGIFKLGQDGGGPYRCMAINHGGGTFSEFWKGKKKKKLHQTNNNNNVKTSNYKNRLNAKQYK